MGVAGRQRCHFITSRKCDDLLIRFPGGWVVQFTREVRFPPLCCQFFLASSNDRKTSRRGKFAESSLTCNRARGEYETRVTHLSRIAWRELRWEGSATHLQLFHKLQSSVHFLVMSALRITLFIFLAKPKETKSRAKCKPIWEGKWKRKLWLATNKSIRNSISGDRYNTNNSDSHAHILTDVCFVCFTL